MTTPARACAVVATGTRRSRARAVKRLAEWAAWVERSSATLASAPDAVPVETLRGCAVTIPRREGCR